MLILNDPKKFLKRESSPQYSPNFSRDLEKGFSLKTLCKGVTLSRPLWHSWLKKDFFRIFVHYDQKTYPNFCLLIVVLIVHIPDYCWAEFWALFQGRDLFNVAWTLWIILLDFSYFRWSLTRPQIYFRYYSFNWWSSSHRNDKSKNFILTLI